MNNTVSILKTLAGLCVLAAFQSTAFASGKHASPAPMNIAYEKYISEDNFFVVLIPEGWGKQERNFSHAYSDTGDKIRGVELSGPQSKDDVRLTISVLHYEYGQFFKNYGRYISLKTGSFTRIAPEKNVPVTNTAVAGREAKTFEIEKFELVRLPFEPPPFKEGIVYEIAPPSKKVTVIDRYIVVPAKKGFYVLNYRAPADMAKEYESVFDRIVSSFEPHEK